MTPLRGWILAHIKIRSLGFAVVLTTYGGVFCNFPKNRPHIWGVSRQLPMSQ